MKASQRRDGGVYHLTTTEEQIATTEARLASYIAAEQAIMSGAQSYSIGNRSLTRANLEHITRMISQLYAQLNRLRRGNQITMHRVVPRDI